MAINASYLTLLKQQMAINANYLTLHFKMTFIPAVPKIIVIAFFSIGSRCFIDGSLLVDLDMNKLHG